MPDETTSNDVICLLPMPRRMIRTAGVLGSPPSVLSVTIDGSVSHLQGYRLSVTPEGASAVAATAAGACYANCTFDQLRKQFPTQMPCVEIEDWPDFPVRGVMLDVSRDKVPTMETLFSLIDLLASWKINQLQLYIEHTFAYSAHPDVWREASPFTADDIRTLDQYCKARWIDLVPNQNSFGHMERWLNHPAYAHLAEAVCGADTGWGFRWKGPFSLCPTDPESLEFLRGLYDELLPNFSSRLFNVGCDETFDIGQGRSKIASAEIGKHRVYLNFVTQVNQLVRSHDRQMMFWGDVILHQPELIAELPKNVIALQWGYEANHPFDEQGEKFARAGVPFYVCPGTSSWNSIAGRTDNAIQNLKSAAEAGLRHGAIGYLNTDWGDHGHLQYLPVSYLGFAAGAAFSWCGSSNANLDWPAVLSRFAFADPTGTLGRVAYDLGNVYQAVGKANSNGSTLFRLMVPSPAEPTPHAGLTPQDLDAAASAIETAVAPLKQFDPTDTPSRLVADELRQAAALLHHCIAIGRLRLAGDEQSGVDTAALVAEHRRLWLARNRTGGLEDSVKRIVSAPTPAS